MPGRTEWLRQNLGLLMNHELSDPSGPAVTNGDLFALNDNRYFSDATRVRQHLLELVAFFFYIHVLRVFPVCRPGILCMRSAAFAINDNFFCHKMDLAFIMLGGCLRMRYIIQDQGRRKL